MVNNRVNLFKWAAAMGFAAFSSVAFSASCEPEEHTWTPSRYYPPGSLVSHQGHWYESRKLHEGKHPGSDFEWKKLETAPECHKGDNRPRAGYDQQGQPQQPKAGSERQQESGLKTRDNTRPACKEPERWSFGDSYTVGSIALHEGQAYRAIRPSNGQMPGLSQPPRWEQVDHPCKNGPASGN